ncbi:MAG: hypothetical protein A4E66_01965 [Syntrophus sp. PtaB.Bin001]|nr:MAG: hypothetical protein A4E66_01965 [Syntrophus sp. PtaB.Bin001]
MGRLASTASFYGKKSVVGVPQEDQAHDEKETFGGDVVRVCPQRVSLIPKPSCDCFNVSELDQWLHCFYVKINLFESLVNFDLSGNP